MKVLSTNIGKPVEFIYKGKTSNSSFFRKPQASGIEIKFHTVVGDEFAGKNIHGTKESIVYAYSRKAQEQLEKIFQKDIPFGHVGENLTMDELFEKDFQVGSVYSIGTAELKARSPRYPCNRFNLCFHGDQYQKLFETFNRPGVYFEVIKEGFIKPGDTFKLLKKGASLFTVLDQYNFMFLLRNDPPKLNLKVLTQVANDPEMPSLFKKAFKARLNELGK